jgi:TRAP-type C4-dicarboxylate transport system permease small subunit
MAVVTLEKMFPGSSNITHGVIWAMAAAAFFTMAIGMFMGIVAVFSTGLPPMARLMGITLVVGAVAMTIFGYRFLQRLIYGPPLKLGRRGVSA